jgi:hypothetical protein
MDFINDVMLTLRAGNFGGVVTRSQLLRVIGQKISLEPKTRAKYIGWMLEFGFIKELPEDKFEVDYRKLDMMGGL